MHLKRLFSFAMAGSLMLGRVTLAQDSKPGQPGYQPPPASIVAAAHSGGSPFNPPEANDATFVVDQDGGLDTGCTFRGGGPLQFTIKIGRVVGNLALLRENGMISETAELRMPAYDIDFDAAVPGFNPERDRVTFNGRVVPTEYLTGSDNVWKLNSFRVPIDWLEFPEDPGRGAAPTPKDNIIRIDIDTANSQEVWCTSIDWAALSIEVARPVVMAHGILSNGGTWSDRWVPGLDGLGLPNSNELNMGNLDSIQNNAGKIANVVTSSKRRWGVDKVNLVCHSKGGLDSRHFVESNSDVEQVIQLGTPNAGSPLADIAQGISLISLGAIPTIVVNALAGPAGVQLTQPYMAIYNGFHGSNSKVRYTALAGNYVPNCRFGIFCAHPIDALLIGITGPGDTIVPVSSVFALGFTQNRLFTTTGGDNNAIHTSLTHEQRVFDGVKDRVQALGTRSLLATDPQQSPIARTATEGGVISQSETRIHLIPVDATTPVFFTLMYPSGNLDLVLISPSGQRFEPNLQSGSAVSYAEEAILGGRMEAYSFSAPESGIWRAEVSAPSVTAPSGEVAYAVHAWIPNPRITFAGSLKQASVHANEALTLTGTVLEDGAPLSGATVTAMVSLPDNSPRQLTLHDDGLGEDPIAGDGMYTALLTETSQSGNYRILFRASGTALSTTTAFSREAFGLATVSRSTSTISGAFSDRGVDTDGDGLFNSLTIDVSLNVTHSGTYRLFGVLTDAHGNTHQANILSTLSSGTATLSLSFDGETIFQNGVDGPYRLSTVRLAEEDGLALLPVSERTDAFQTAAYSYRQFQHAPILLTGGGSAVGVDINRNGLFDQLDVQVGVDVEFAGFYNWSARLIDVNGHELGFASNSGFFDAGNNSLSLVYAGQPIGRNGVDGPYFVTDLLLFGTGGSLVAPKVLTTDPFRASQFEGYVVDGTPPTLSVSLSPRLLWPPNHQMVEIEATISVQDDVDPHPSVRLVSIKSSEADNGLGDGDTAGDIQDASLGTDDRQFLLRAERSATGPGRIYTITYEARNAAGRTSTLSTQVTVPRDRSK